MNKRTVIILLISILSLNTFHSKARCSLAGASFKQNYAHNFQNENVIFIKGIALDAVEYGRYIKVIEDLKGNFTGDSTIVVWGAEDPTNCEDVYDTNEKVDHLTRYQVDDTLIMLVRPVAFVCCIEVFNGYATFDCTHSVLKLSNGNVTGYINPIKGEIWKETTMPWDELLRFLSNDDFINAFDSDSAVWSYMYACGSSPSILYKTILYGDTVIDGIKWKIVTDPYVLKGLVRTDGQRVIFKDYPGYGYGYANGEITIYDFSLNIGDSVLTHYSSSSPSTKHEIIKIDSIVLGDCKKHKQMIGPTCIIEGVGMADSHPFYMIFPLPTCASGPFLVCCEVDGEFLYKNPMFYDCMGNRVANETVIDNSQKVNILFVSGQLRVVLADEALFDVTLYNMQGMMLLQKKNNRNEMLANLDNLSKGVYVVSVTSGKTAYSKKIIK